MVLTNTIIACALALFTASTDAQLVEKKYSSYATDQQNILRHLGGTGPFAEAIGFGISTETPYNCTVDQAHLFMRHGERYPSTKVGKTLKTLYTKLKDAAANLTEVVGPLSFVNDLTYFADTEFYEQETFTGPYAGIGNAFTFGNIMRERYAHLVNTSKTLPIFTAGKKRVYDSAYNFAQGFTFNQYDQNYTMVVLPETSKYGVNSLTNTKACPNFDSDYEGPMVNMSLSYKTYEADRLNALSPGFNITEDDISNMCTYCGFELNIRGESAVCDALSQDALVGFGYERDLNAYYGNGPGYNMSFVSGSAFTNATLTLLKDNKTEENLYLSFSHDNDLLRYLTFLGLIDIDDELPVDHVEFYKFFSASGIVPMGARFITERLSCYNETTQTDEKYVRFLLNDQVVPFPSCSTGPGYSCPLDTYADIIESELLDFTELCGQNTSTPQYLGGNGPFVESIGFGISTETPYQCSIDQAHLFMRHGERYPDVGTGNKLENLFNKLRYSNAEPKGPLAFMKDYTYFAPKIPDNIKIDNDKNNIIDLEYFVQYKTPYDQETFTGPYSGTTDAFQLGSILRERYNHLVDNRKPLPIFTTNMRRIYDTAKLFAQGFTFNKYESDYKMVVLSESKEFGANSLTNVEACLTFKDGYMGPLVNISLPFYKKREADRLNRLSPGFQITEEDVYNMCNYCGFELNVRGKSDFCNAITMDTWIGYSYEKSVISYYNKGPGYNMSYVLGGVYVNATATLLADNSENIGKLFFSFSHDNELLRYVTSLGFFDRENPLPVDSIEFNSFYSSSEILPMGARLITERLKCYNEKSGVEDKYVRFLLNDQVIPLPLCNSGPGYSCPIEKYLNIVEKQTMDYSSICDINPNWPQHLSFWWDWESGKYPTTHAI
ncbi:acid phosphatase pho5 [Pichia californica]|uniref:Acid phosphatase pho5 n=1 Tax=Pichia californica TaxID=460514 RepID=A0A9P6WNX1_9ASCO|nr:acid phosphatase pho5 [[Candida] californica]